jgi:hypothetical protein
MKTAGRGRKPVPSGSLAGKKELNPSCKAAVRSLEWAPQDATTGADIVRGETIRD